MAEGYDIQKLLDENEKEFEKARRPSYIGDKFMTQVDNILQDKDVDKESTEHENDRKKGD